MKKIFLIAIGSVIFMSCKTDKQTPEVEEKSEIEQVQIQDEASEALQLNNGEKWMVNDEMKPFVIKSEALVESYIKDNKTDYKTLAQEIKDQNNQLIKSCTMDGPSHDELHKWLHPHLELVGKLAETDDAAQAQPMVTELQTSYQTYHQYFN